MASNIYCNEIIELSLRNKVVLKKYRCDIDPWCPLQDGVLLLLEILRESIEAMSKDDLAAQHTPLVTLFCHVLDLSNTPELKVSS